MRVKPHHHACQHCGGGQARRLRMHAEMITHAVEAILQPRTERDS